LRPLPVTLDMDGQKIAGFVMKLNPTGAMIELESIPYRVGAILKMELQLRGRSTPIVESVRAIKSYDRFVRPSKNKEASSVPKKLSEVHFIRLAEIHRLAIVKFLVQEQVELSKRR
jgi:hypothetical protein